jgi:hypothetical protein
MNLKKTIMKRDGLTSEEADEQIMQFEKELNDLMNAPDCSLCALEDLMEASFGLEPDYLDPFIM